MLCSEATLENPVNPKFKVQEAVWRLRGSQRQINQRKARTYVGEKEVSRQSSGQDTGAEPFKWAGWPVHEWPQSITQWANLKSTGSEEF